MKVKVNKDLCIGCGACQAIAPDVFEIEDDGLATAKVSEVPDVFEIEDDGLATSKVSEVPENIKEDVIDALEGCPTSAIEEVNE